MNRLVIFLNELSCLVENPISPENLLYCVLLTLATLRAARKLRRDLLIASQIPISGLPLGDGTQYFGTILNGNLHKEEWRFINGLAQSSPWGAYPGATPPEDLQGVSFEGKAAVGMSWATANHSAVFSFGHPPNWNSDVIRADFESLEGPDEVKTVPIEVPNLSAPGHVEVHHYFIRDFGRDVSPSSLIRRADSFDIRMYFYDHNPPHFHIILRSGASAKCDIQTRDIIAGDLPPALQTEVGEWATVHRQALMENWRRCQIGDHPLVVG